MTAKLRFRHLLEPERVGPQILLAAVIAVCPASAQNKPIDVPNSTITIHVGKSGLFSIVGHEHWVNAPIASGLVNDAAGAEHVEFTVDAARMEVKPDPKVDAKTQAEIQRDMQEKVLESSRYPSITFLSTRVERQENGRWTVTGMLNLHGVTKPVTVSVALNGNTYVSRAKIRQTDFGIKPITAGAGTVKVKDELNLEFRISLRQ